MILKKMVDFFLHLKVKLWTVEDVSTWLRSINLENYVNIFKANNITGESILELSE